MSDVPRPVPARRYWLLTFAVALAAGFLGANPFADAVGLSHVTKPNEEEGLVFLRIFCGLIVGLVVLGLIPFLGNQCRDVAAVLGRTTERPGPAVAVTLVICGTLCLLGSLVLAWHVASLAQSASIQVQAPGMPGFSAGPLSGTTGRSQAPGMPGFPGPISGAASVNAGTQPPLLTQVLALLTFLAGLALISLGIWSSIKPAGTRVAAAVPAPPREGVLAASDHPFPGGQSG